MRFAVTVLLGGVAVASLLMPQFPVHQLTSRTPFLQPLLLLVVAVVIGTVADRRAWLSAGCAYLAGLAVWVAAWLRPSPPWAPSDNWFLETWVQFVLGNVLVGALIFAGVATAAHIVTRVIRRRTLQQT